MIQQLAKQPRPGGAAGSRWRYIKRDPTQRGTPSGLAPPSGVTSKTVHFKNVAQWSNKVDPLLYANGNLYEAGSFFVGLSKNGSWKRPQGYKSPEEIKAEFELEEMKRLKKIRDEKRALEHEIMNDEFEEWYSKADESEVDQLIEGMGNPTVTKMAANDLKMRKTMVKTAWLKQPRARAS